MSIPFQASLGRGSVPVLVHFITLVGAPGVVSVLQEQSSPGMSAVRTGPGRYTISFPRGSTMPSPAMGWLSCSLLNPCGATRCSAGQRGLRITWAGTLVFDLPRGGGAGPRLRVQCPFSVISARVNHISTQNRTRPDGLRSSAVRHGRHRSVFIVTTIVPTPVWWCAPSRAQLVHTVSATAAAEQIATRRALGSVRPRRRDAAAGDVNSVVEYHRRGPRPARDVPPVRRGLDRGAGVGGAAADSRARATTARVTEATPSRTPRARARGASLGRR
jgi:hypothetical protein